MQRIFIAFLFLLAAAFPAVAAPAQTSGNASIDAQWEQVSQQGQTPVNPHTAPTRGIFRALFGASPEVVTPPSATAPPRVYRPQAQVRRDIDRRYLPAVVDYPTDEAPGTIVIDTGSRYLYHVLPDGQAQRYGVGVGREGFGWSGTVRVGRKAEWPTWTPPAEMRRRQPYLPVSMPGGPDNPLGAGALYLHDGGRDTLFRIHGSNEPWTIGHAVSSGCFRMRNEDVTELYSRVSIGTRVVVR